MHTIIKLNQPWHLGEPLGSGGFGKVYEALSDDGSHVVVKLIPKVPGNERELQFDDLQELTNVVPVLDSGEWGDHWALVMPKAEESLRDHLEKADGGLPIEESVQILTDIVEALVSIEGRIVHRDIKPENILLLDGHWCLADFGISRYAEATTATDTWKYAKSYPYAAPEQWRGDRATRATDVYATGVVAYELLTGRRPFEGPEIHDFRRQHLVESPAQIMGIPPRVQSLIFSCLNKSAEARPEPENLLEQLQEGLQPASAVAGRLQQANALVVRQKAETSRQQSIARSEKERHLELLQAADQAFDGIVSLLHHRIMADAPDCTYTGPLPNRSWSLNDATLSVEPSRMVQVQPNTVLLGSPVEVIAYSSVVVRIPPDRSGYKGRSHSIWYCDAKEPGVFRWYETAFMRLFASTEFAPFALNPDTDAYRALSRALDVFQVAWPFTAIDQGDEEDFIDRWLDWFVDAVEGKLSYPSQMPERETHGSWRS